MCMHAAFLLLPIWGVFGEFPRLAFNFFLVPSSRAASRLWNFTSFFSRFAMKISMRANSSAWLSWKFHSSKLIGNLIIRNRHALLHSYFFCCCCTALKAEHVHLIIIGNMYKRRKGRNNNEAIVHANGNLTLIWQWRVVLLSWERREKASLENFRKNFFLAD